MLTCQCRVQLQPPLLLVSKVKCLSCDKNLVIKINLYGNTCTAKCKVAKVIYNLADYAKELAMTNSGPLILQRLQRNYKMTLEGQHIFG